MERKLHGLMGLAIFITFFLYCLPSSQAFTLTRSEDASREYYMDTNAGNVGTHFDPMTGAIGSWANIYEPVYVAPGESSRREGEAQVRSSAMLSVTKPEWVYFGMIHHGNVDVYGSDKSAYSSFDVSISFEVMDIMDMDFTIKFRDYADQSSLINGKEGSLDLIQYVDTIDLSSLDWEDPYWGDILYGLMQYEHTPFAYSYLFQKDSVTFDGGRFYSEHWYALFLDPGDYSIDFGIHTEALSAQGEHDLEGNTPQGFAFADSRLTTFGAPGDDSIPRDDEFHTGAYFLFSESPEGNVDGVFDLGMHEGVPSPPPAVPIPSAVWLLGSGLIGVVGFRKKLRKS